MKGAVLTIASLAILAPGVESRSQYRSLVPNGWLERPNSQGQQSIFSFGHIDMFDAEDGMLNPFGKDFQIVMENNPGRDFWPELCALDSDKDGKTNGEELGDPNCQWQQSSIPNGGTVDFDANGIPAAYGSGFVSDPGVDESKTFAPVTVNNGGTYAPTKSYESPEFSSNEGSTFVASLFGVAVLAMLR